MTGYFDILPDFHRHFGLNPASGPDPSGAAKNKQPPPLLAVPQSGSAKQRSSLFSSAPLRVPETVSASPTPSDPRVQNVGTVQFSRPQRHDGGTVTAAGAHGAKTHANKLIPFPSGSIITPCATFKPLDSGDPFHDEVALSLVGCFLLSVAFMFGGLFLLTSYLH